MRKINNIKIYWIALAIVLVVGWIWSYPAYFDWLKDFRPQANIDEDFIEIADQSATLTDKSLSLPAIPDARIFKWSDNTPVYDMFQTFTARGSLSFRNPYGGLMLYFLNEEIERNKPVGIYLRALGIERVYLRIDMSPKIISEIDKSRNLELFSNDPDLELIESTEQLAVFRVKEPNPEVFSNQETITVIGGLDAYRQLIGIDNFDLTKNNVVFAHQSLDQSWREIIEDSRYLVFNNQHDLNDLTYNFLEQPIVLRPAEFARAADPENNWVAASVYEPVHGEWHKVLKEILGTNNWDYDYGLGLIYSNRLEKPDSPPPILKIPFTVSAEEDYTISVRLFKHLQGGEIALKIDDGNWINVNCGDLQNRIAWEEIMKERLIAGEHDIFVKSNDGFNAINTIVLSSDYDLRQAQAYSSKLVTQKNVIVTQELRPVDVLSNRLNAPELLSNADIWEFITSSQESSQTIPNDKKTPLFEKFNLAGRAINYVSPGPFIQNLRKESIKSDENSWKITSLEPEDRIILGPFPVQANEKYYFKFTALCDEAERINFRILQYHDQEKVEANNAVTADSSFINLKPENGKTDLIIPIGVRNNIQFIALEAIASNYSQKSDFSWRINTPQLYAEKDLEDFLGSLIIYDSELRFANEQLASTAEKYQPSQIGLAITTPVTSFSLIETYDPLWQANSEDKKLSGFPNYGVLTSFFSKEQINEVEACFFPEKPYRVGMIISILAISVSGLIFALKLVINRRKQKISDYK